MFILFFFFFHLNLLTYLLFVKLKKISDRCVWNEILLFVFVFFKNFNLF